MIDRGVLRWGGLAAMIGAGLGLVFNLLHPRGDVDTVREELELVADSGIWVFDHYMLAWSLAFSLVGLVAIGWSFADGPAQSWARIATAVGIGSIVVALITIGVDGMAQASVAEEWAKAQNTETYATAAAVAEISLALFTMTIGSLFGLTPILFSLAGFTTAQYPRWLAWLASIAGVVGLVAASIQYLGGKISPASLYLFLAASLAYTVWLFVMGWQLWSGAPAPSTAEPASGAIAA